MIKILLLVGSGGFLGSISRYILSKYLTQANPGAFPVGTFAVNIIGCLIIGLLIGFSAKSSLSSELRFFLATGFCGGFTTFSTYSLEAFQILEKGEAGLSLVYVFGSILVGLICIWLGFWIAHSVISG